MRGWVQSVIILNADGNKEKVAYRSSGWLPKGMGYGSGAKSTMPTHSSSPEGAEGGSR